MITNGFTYIAVLVFIAALLVWLQRYTKSKFFDYAPPIVLLYLITMILCTLGAWDMEATKPAYSVLKNNLLYAMIFLMLLRCDIRKIIKLGPKMLGGFFAASVSISLAFIATFAIMKGPLGSEAWKALGALCGSWMGGSGNMIAVQAALDIGEADMAYALVVDSIDYSIWVMFLLWAINLAPKFNKWVKADTTTLDEVSRRLEEDAKGNEDKASFVNLIFLLGLALVISAFGQDIGAALNGAMPFLDKATWTVLLITLSGLIGAVTPVGRMAGSTELSNLLLYSVVALLASRASFLELTDAPAWILAGFMILAIHGIILVSCEMEMEPERVYAHPMVRADAGCVALRRGPIIYTFEGVDNGEDLQTLRIPREAKIEVLPYQADLLEGIVALRVTGCRKKTAVNPALYAEDAAQEEVVTLQAIPYYAWCNRGMTHMRVWMQE